MTFPFKRRKTGDDTQQELFDTTRSYKEDIEDFITKWNSFVWLPKIVGSDRQAKQIRHALARPFFARNWRACFGMLAKSSFVWSKMKPRLDIDWYLIPDNFDKIMEGKYLDDKYRQESQPTSPQQTQRQGDDEEII
jgi:hypothetical protein